MRPPMLGGGQGASVGWATQPARLLRWCRLSDSNAVLRLQAQQALLAVQWPPGLEQVQNPDISNHTDPGGSRKGSSEYCRQHSTHRHLAASLSACHASCSNHYVLLRHAVQQPLLSACHRYGFGHWLALAEDASCVCCWPGLTCRAPHAAVPTAWLWAEAEAGEHQQQCTLDG